MTELIEAKTHWFADEGKRHHLQLLLADPILQEALNIVRLEAQSDPTIAALICKEKSAGDAAFFTSLAHTKQTGMIAALRILSSLCKLPPVKKAPDIPEPYAHITENYLEEKTR